MDKIVKKVNGKSENSGEESGWIYRQSEREKEKKEFGCGSCGEKFTEFSEYWEHATNCDNQKGWN